MGGFKEPSKGQISPGQRLRFFDSLMSSTRDFVYLLDVSGRFLYANQALLDLWQKDLDDVLGKGFGELGYPPELVEKHREQIETVTELKKPLRDSNAYNSPEGDWGYYEYIFTPVLDADGQVEAIAGVTRDITKRKKALDTLYRSLTAAKMVAWEWDHTRRELSTIPGPGEAETIPFDLEGDDVTNAYDLLHPDDRKRHGQLQFETLQNGGDYVSEYRLRTPDGEGWIWIEDTARAEIDSMGNRRLVGIARDITDRKEAELELREAYHRKDRFLAILSHELRNPLSPIKLSLQILEHADPGSESEAQAIRTMERQVDQLERLVNDLLDVTRLTQERIELQKDSLEFNELVSHAVDDHRPLFDERGVALGFTPHEHPLFVDGDRERLAQAVGNLLQNAAKFTEPGGSAKLSITWDEKHGVAELAVVDDGIGFDDETFEHIFEPFAQADISLARSHGGLGLGLAIVKGLVELHGGEVEAQSQGTSQGARFLLRLPAQREEKNVEGAPVEFDSTSSLSILLIEDQPDVAESLAKLLEFKGHRVTVAYDGQSGIDEARARRPDVVICDIGLPGIDGYGVARTLREDPQLQDSYLLALSGYASSDDVDKSTRAGFDHHLAKPPDMKELDRLLTQYRQH